MLWICVSIAGTMPLLVCLLLMLLKRKNFSYRLGRKLVLLSLVEYFIPFQMLKYYLPQDMLEETNSLNAISYFVNFDDNEAVSYHGISVWMPDWILMIVLCWLFVIAGFSIYETIKYHQLTRKLKRITEIRTYPLPGIGNVEYRISPEMNTPYTVGFVKPFIVAPAEFPNSKLSEMILRHEYSHLRRRDSIVKLICLLAICLHYFNPLTILTILLYTRFSENIADEAATEGCSDEERRAYAKALVRLSARTRQVPVVWRNNLLGDKKESMKRRVELIMNRNKKASKIGTVAAVLASVILSGTTVFAYTPMQTTRNNTEHTSNMEAITFQDTATSETPISDSQIYFTDSDNNTVVLDSSNLEARAIFVLMFSNLATLKRMHLRVMAAVLLTDIKQEFVQNVTILNLMNI